MSYPRLNSYEMWFWPASSGRGSMAKRFVVEAIKTTFSPGQSTSAATA